MQPGGRVAGGILALLLACASASAGDALYYVVEGGKIVFTNVPTGGEARPVPGLGPDSLPRPARGSGAALPETIYDTYIDRVAAETGLAPDLIKAVAVVESGFDPHAVSPKGAQGLMQLMPETARAYGVRDAFDPLENLRAGAQHLRKQMDAFDDDVGLALAAYNAGAGAVRRHGGIPAYPETREYVRRVHERLGEHPPASTRSRPEPGAVGDPPGEEVRIETRPDGSILLAND